MLVTFKSNSSSDFAMYEKEARRIVDVLGKDVTMGVIPPAEGEDAIKKLEAAMHEMPDFASKIYPVVEMLRMAQATNENVTWRL